MSMVSNERKRGFGAIKLLGSWSAEALSVRSVCVLIPQAGITQASAILPLVHLSCAPKAERTASTLEERKGIYRGDIRLPGAVICESWHLK